MCDDKLVSPTAFPRRSPNTTTRLCSQCSISITALCTPVTECMLVGRYRFGAGPSHLEPDLKFRQVPVSIPTRTHGSQPAILSVQLDVHTLGPLDVGHPVMEIQIPGGDATAEEFS